MNFIAVVDVAGKFRPKMSRHAPGEVPGSAIGLKIFLKLYFYVKCQSLNSFRCSKPRITKRLPVMSITRTGPLVQRR